MKRRDFLALAGAAAAFPHAAFAQRPAKVPRVVLISNAIPADQMFIGADTNYSIILEELASRGFVEGHTVTYERYLVANDRAAEAMPPIIASAPDVIFFGGASVATQAAMALTKTIPMVSWLDDLLGRGVVSDMAHPGGNVTGLNAVASLDAQAKLLELLAEAVPTAKKFAWLVEGMNGAILATFQKGFDVVTAAANKLGVSLVPALVEAGVATEGNFAQAFDFIASNRIEAVLFANATITQAGAPVLARLALAAKMPAISQYAAFADAGGFMSYGADIPAQSRQAADYIALILNGAKPGDLPVLQPTVFLFEINQKTAKAIGVSVPTTVLAQATSVIE